MIRSHCECLTARIRYKISPIGSKYLPQGGDAALWRTVNPDPGMRLEKGHTEHCKLVRIWLTSHPQRRVGSLGIVTPTRFKGDKDCGGSFSDLLLVGSHGGRLAYRGRRSGAVEYWRHVDRLRRRTHLRHHMLMPTSRVLTYRGRSCAHYEAR